MSRVLELEGITAGYGETQILHGVSLHVDAGEIVVIIGPNGAGKSTAMKAVFGLLAISAGTIRLTGEEITDMPPQQVVRKGVAYVPQVGNVFVSLSVEENLEMGAYVSNDDPGPRIEEIYKLFPPLRDKRRQPAGALSGGQRQMVAMGRALMLHPKILLLDEPTAGLSPKYRGEIFEMIRAINRAGATILMVEQNARMALEVADRGYVLVDGENRYEGTGRELIGDAEVARMFLGASGNPPGGRAA
ncbi:MAG TPA: ABC transporter ATP-binding protein [Thermohalobaculum sp.]|nr:ABC transporter ATP-binding protein [Thermohalobaculum sp.]